ncbi:MAG: methylmalonyl-CoA mutase family protein [Candidatus Marinimicrobia bacterium]|jgi:methylmalonyl-CoA mutase N-terminal domain/subunit|nr:methylmalonyl-CoA mutase family protein [Candidatus Neomarinimicrobiota bacterium]MDP7026041.1 methylmalonyl-CoA mutase family protein [Candidatus Neomarinimicrobiota bacterium]|tara:strand:- start:1404 stop:2897 length:1494 start_codon:yes stop_codon:yes gene_type:complete
MSNKEQAGKYPFTRGVYPEMYRQRLWTMRQYAGFTSSEETNRRYRHLLKQGVTGLSVAFDLPTQIGYDSDHAMAQGEVGRVGVPICTLEDMEILMDEIPQNEVSTSMTINSTAAILLAFYAVAAEKKGIPLEKLRGTVQNDILKEYVARGTYIFPTEPSLKIVTDIFEFCGQNMPKWNTISVSGYHIREAGSTAAQELAFTLANGIAYVQAAVDRGLNVDDFAPRLSFFFNAHIDFFEEISKFRAARRLWAKIMKERFGATNPKSMMCRIHTQTAGSSLTAQQIDNNVVRTAVEAMAAVLGGTQSLHTNARDEALALPTEASAELALRTQQIIAHETRVTDAVDPLGGSYYVEALTNQLEADAKALIRKIDERGGAAAAIEQNFIQDEISRSAYETQKRIDSGEQVVVGLNKFTGDEEQIPELQQIDLSGVEQQKTRLKAFKKKRNSSAALDSLSALKVATENGDNLLPPILDAVRSHATLGEISSVLREVYGEYKE